METQLTKGSKVSRQFSTLHYINVPRILLSIAASIPSDDSFWLSHGTIENLFDLNPYKWARVLHLFQLFCMHWRPNALPLSLKSISNENRGALIEFNDYFRTKGVPYPEDARSYVLKGDLERDPHIYRKIGGIKVYLQIDPRWITTTTAFCDFGPPSGGNYFSGLGILKQVDVKSQLSVITPLVIGLPYFEGGFSFGPYGWNGEE